MTFVPELLLVASVGAGSMLVLWIAVNVLLQKGRST